MRRLLAALFMMFAVVAVVAPPAMADEAPNGQIAFDENVCCDYDIWVVNPDGTGLTNLTNTPDVQESGPVWSPDGTHIAFTRIASDGVTGDIWVMDPDGSNQVNLTNSEQSEFGADWAPDSAQLIFTRDIPGVFITSQFDLFTINVDGTGEVNVTNSDANEFAPSWSPNGDRIVFAGVRSQNYEIVTADPDGTDQIVISRPDYDDHAPDWSPDGSKLVWMSQFFNPCCLDWEVWAMNADGSGATNLTQHPSTDWFPSWSPDGTLIVFESFRDGGTFGDLYTIDAPTVLPPPAGATTSDAAAAAAEATKLPITSDAASPDWGPDLDAPVDPLLTVLRAGTGTGTVTSTPAGISCGTDCTQTYATGTSVILTQTPAAGSTFTGWSGACTGTGSCVVTMNAAKTVTATFTATATGAPLDVTVVGSGSVRSAPTGINCGTDCTETYNLGTVVTLTARAGRGVSFTGWSGACTGTGSCVVTMDAAKSVTATFGGGGGTTFPLTVTTTGAGRGTVTSSPAGIKCGSDCTQDYTSGTVVTLTATARGSVFTGWSGACTGTGSCVVTMNAAKTVTATFTATATFATTGLTALVR